jgi:hypothetical protein
MSSSILLIDANNDRYSKVYVNIIYNKFLNKKQRDFDEIDIITIQDLDTISDIIKYKVIIAGIGLKLSDTYLKIINEHVDTSSSLTFGGRLIYLSVNISNVNDLSLLYSTDYIVLNNESDYNLLKDNFLQYSPCSTTFIEWCPDIACLLYNDFTFPKQNFKVPNSIKTTIKGNKYFQPLPSGDNIEIFLYTVLSSTETFIYDIESKYDLEEILCILTDTTLIYPDRTIKTYPVTKATLTSMCVTDISRIINDVIQYNYKRLYPPHYINKTQVILLKQKVIQRILKIVLGNNYDPMIVNRLLNGECLANVIQSGNSIDLKVQIIQEILWEITNDPFSPYMYDLLTAFTFQTRIESLLDWLIRDFYVRYHVKKCNNNIEYININFQEIHRSGWQYVVNNMQGKLNYTAPERSYTEKIIIDTFVDKTFHWNHEFYKNKGIIPYKRTWVGIIHHTFSNYGNMYNCKELFKNQNFIESLQHCKGLIVLSEYLKTQIENTIRDNPTIDFTGQIWCLVHPTEFISPESLFTFSKFLNNQDKKVVHVGCWLRDMFSIYQLPIDPEAKIRKCILKGKNMDNYFFNDSLDVLFDDQSPIKNDEPNHICRSVNYICRSINDICRYSFNNKFIQGLHDYIYTAIDSVEIIEELSNQDYDDLLSQNIVYIKLIDASAVNTILECIVRNTPVLVNKIPAVIEMLGEDYPFYYTNNIEAIRKVTDYNLINETWEYLSSSSFIQDIKQKLDIDYFITQFQQQILW